MPAAVTQLIVDASGAESGVQRYTNAMQSGIAASDRLAAAEAKLQARLDEQAQSYDAASRAANAAQMQMDKVAQAQSRAASASAGSVKAANDNTAALSRQAEAYKSAGKFALEHPLLVLAGSVAAARALSGLATSAAGSLGAASVSTAAFAEGAAGMGTTVVGGAALAARGLSGLSAGATVAAGGLAAYADKVAGMTTATTLLSRALSVIPGLFWPIAAAFVAFEVASSAIGKAYADLERLIQLGEKAEKLDVAAPFLKSFEGLGPKLRVTADEMDAVLAKASSFVKDTWGQGNSLSKLFNDINATGIAGAGGLQATTSADLASTTQDRIRAALAGMKELDDLGLHLVAMDVGGKVFGPEFVERIRTGQTTIAQFVADLDAASQKEVLKQEQVDRAVALNRAIADTKQAISDAWAVTVDFSGAAILLNEAWLKILQAVQWVVEAINSAIGAVSGFASAVASGIGGAFDSVSNKVTSLLSQMGVVAKQQAAAEVQGPPEAYGPPEQKITARQFPYVFGPDAPTMQKAAGAAKQAKEAAQATVSSYDNLIQRTKDRIEELDLETQSVGKSSEAVIKLKLAHDMERAAKKDGITVTEQMRQETDRLGTSLAASTDHLANAKRQLELTKETQRELADDFGNFADDVVLGGKKISEAFADLSRTLASSTMKALLTGQGGLAGLFGTAGEKSGDLGGLLGGKLSFGSLFGGNTPDAAGSPLPGAQGPSMPSTSMFGGLFDGDKITKALNGGAESGIGNALSTALKPKAGGGILTSPLGGAIATVGAGAAIGYSSQSPLMGALGGGIAGLASGNPLLAVAGAGAGLLGGLFGESQAKKQAKKQLQQELQARREAYDQAKPQIAQLDATFLGESIGAVGSRIADAETQLKQAAKSASDAGDTAKANKLVADFQTYVARMVATFAEGFNSVRAEVEEGFGTSGPFSTALSAVQSLGESLKAFVADAGKLSDPSLQGAARGSAVQGALASLQTPKTLSATQQEIARINGTATGLNQVLKDLGLSAEQAAAAIKDGTTKALDQLRDKFNDDLGRKINDAQNKGYLNDAADLIKEVSGLRIDAGAIGGDVDQVEVYFSSAAQKLVDGSQLVGSAFQDLIAKFPELQGKVHEYSEASTKSADEMAKAAAEALAQIQDRKRAIEDRAFAVNFSDNSLSTKLTTFDRSAEWEQWQEMAKGGQALDELIAAQLLERNKLIADYNAAVRARQLTFSNRQFAASNDTSTLGGQLAAYDRQAQQEREEEAKNGGEALIQLEAAQYAERAKIVIDWNKQIADKTKAQLDAAQSAFEAFVKNIKTYLDNLRAGPNSPLSPKDRLAAAQSQYDAQLSLAKGGDRTALDNITQYSDTLLEASKAYNASGEAYQATYQKILGDLEKLPTQVSAEQFIVDAIKDSADAIVTATQVMQASLLAGVQANSPALVATALSQYFSTLDTSVNGLLDYGEFSAGLGPLATAEEQRQAKVIFNAIDTNGDGQLSRLELQNASSYRVEQYTASTNSNTDQANNIGNAQKATMDNQAAYLNSINGLTSATLGTQQQIAALNSSNNAQNSFIQQNTGYTNDLITRQYGTQAGIYDLTVSVLNNLRAANSKNGAGVFATGGWISGPGTGTSDSIAARVSNGEFVVNAASARVNGPLLEALNDNRSFALPTVGVPVGGGRDDSALIAEVRALRAEIAQVRAAVKENTGVAEAGHLGTMGAVRGNTAAVADGNATASRRSLARPTKAA